MKYLKRFNEGNISIYDKEKWEKFLPKKITIIKDNKKHTFDKSNILVNSDMLQIIYSNSGKEWGSPDQLEFDIYFLNQNGNIKLDVDITYGDLVVSEFTILSPNKVSVVEYTSKGSKFDPSNTLFAFDKNSLNGIVNFLTKFSGLNLNLSDFQFLDYD